MATPHLQIKMLACIAKQLPVLVNNSRISSYWLFPLDDLLLNRGIHHTHKPYHSKEICNVDNVMINSPRTNLSYMMQVP